jgi:hypothetical protein
VAGPLPQCPFGRDCLLRARSGKTSIPAGSGLSSRAATDLRILVTALAGVMAKAARLDGGAADAVALVLPACPGGSCQPATGGTEGPQVTCVPAGTTAQSNHWSLVGLPGCGPGPMLIMNLDPLGIAEGLMVYAQAG